jgi:hypothetical protein
MRVAQAKLCWLPDCWRQYVWALHNAPEDSHEQRHCLLRNDLFGRLHVDDEITQRFNQVCLLCASAMRCQLQINNKQNGWGKKLLRKKSRNQGQRRWHFCIEQCGAQAFLQ